MKLAYVMDCPGIASHSLGTSNVCVLCSVCAETRLAPKKNHSDTCSLGGLFSSIVELQAPTIVHVNRDTRTKVQPKWMTRWRARPRAPQTAELKLLSVIEAKL